MSADTLQGDSVVNRQGETLGEIQDIMIDVPSGKVGYAVLSFGGFLGINDKLFAIPWNALTLDADNEQFILDVPKERLDSAPGFDKDHWAIDGGSTLGKGDPFLLWHATLLGSANLRKIPLWAR